MASEHNKEASFTDLILFPFRVVWAIVNGIAYIIAAPFRAFIKVFDFLFYGLGGHSKARAKAKATATPQPELDVVPANEATTVVEQVAEDGKTVIIHHHHHYGPADSTPPVRREPFIVTLIALPFRIFWAILSLPHRIFAALFSKPVHIANAKDIRKRR